MAGLFLLVPTHCQIPVELIVSNDRDTPRPEGNQFRHLNLSLKSGPDILDGMEKEKERGNKKGDADKQHGHEFNFAVPVRMLQSAGFSETLRPMTTTSEVMKSLKEYRELTKMALLPLTRPIKAMKTASSRLIKVTSGSALFPHLIAITGYSDRLKHYVTLGAVPLFR